MKAVASFGVLCFIAVIGITVRALVIEISIGGPLAAVLTLCIILAVLLVALVLLIVYGFRP